MIAAYINKQMTSLKLQFKNSLRPLSDGNKQKKEIIEKMRHHQFDKESFNSSQQIMVNQSYPNICSAFKHVEKLLTENMDTVANLKCKFDLIESSLPP